MKRRTRLLGASILAVLLAVPLLVAPRMVRGLAAEEWLAHFAAMDGLPRPRKLSARLVAAKAEVAIANLAPFPQAGSAARLALDIGEKAQHGDRDPEAARLIYAAVRASCAQARDGIFGGVGFAVVEARALTLEASLPGGDPR